MRVMNGFFPAAPNRRSTLALATTGLLSGCAAASRSPFFGTLANFRRSATPPLDPSEIEASPYASMQAWFKGNSKALLVLGEYQANDRLVWYSADKQSLTTWGPFILRVLGLEVSVRDTLLSGPWSKDLRSMIDRSVEKAVNFQTKSRVVTMRTRSTFRSADLESISLLNGSRMLRRIEEHVVADGAHRFTNVYWIEDASGFCWKSQQLVIPTMTPFNIEITKAPKRA